jgi:type IV pilus assembly protein PilW
MHLPIKKKPYQSGISMIDLLVGMAISMLAMLMILNLSVVFESRRKVSLDSSETQINAVNVISMLERDVRLSGYGFGPMEAWGCGVKRHYISRIDDHALLPIEIIAGDNGAPDSLRIMASGKKENSVSYVLLNAHPASATTMLLNSNLGIDVNDILILHEQGKPCTMFQATHINNDSYRISHEGLTSPWNPDSADSLFPVGGYGVGASVINLGQVFDRKYTINNRNELEIENYLSANNSLTTVPIAPHIVNLQAQYGFDARSGIQTNAKVTKWSEIMLDADGSQVIGDNGDLRRLLAIRIAIVARSEKKEKAASGVCNISSTPTWRAGNATTGELENSEIDVSKNPDRSNNSEWRCYRYRVYETVVPLRNLMWGLS